MSFEHGSGLPPGPNQNPDQKSPNERQGNPISSNTPKSPEQRRLEWFQQQQKALAEEKARKRIEAQKGKIDRSKRRESQEGEDPSRDRKGGALTAIADRVLGRVRDSIVERKRQEIENYKAIPPSKALLEIILGKNRELDNEVYERFLELNEGKVDEEKFKVKFALLSKDHQKDAVYREYQTRKDLQSTLANLQKDIDAQKGSEEDKQTVAMIQALLEDSKQAFLFKYEAAYEKIPDDIKKDKVQIENFINGQIKNKVEAEKLNRPRSAEEQLKAKLEEDKETSGKSKANKQRQLRVDRGYNAKRLRKIDLQIKKLMEDLSNPDKKQAALAKLKALQKEKIKLSLLQTTILAETEVRGTGEDKLLKDVLERHSTDNNLNMLLGQGTELLGKDSQFNKNIIEVLRQSPDVDAAILGYIDDEGRIKDQNIKSITEFISNLKPTDIGQIEQEKLKDLNGGYKEFNEMLKEFKAEQEEFESWKNDESKHSERVGVVKREILALISTADSEEMIQEEADFLLEEYNIDADNRKSLDGLVKKIIERQNKGREIVEDKDGAKGDFLNKLTNAFNGPEMQGPALLNREDFTALNKAGVLDIRQTPAGVVLVFETFGINENNGDLDRVKRLLAKLGVSDQELQAIKNGSDVESLAVNLKDEFLQKVFGSNRETGVSIIVTPGSLSEQDELIAHEITHAAQESLYRIELDKKSDARELGKEYRALLELATQTMEGRVAPRHRNELDEARRETRTRLFDLYLHKAPQNSDQAKIHESIALIVKDVERILDAQQADVTPLGELAIRQQIANDILYKVGEGKDMNSVLKGIRDTLKMYTMLPDNAQLQPEYKLAANFKQYEYREAVPGTREEDRHRLLHERVERQEKLDKYFDFARPTTWKFMDDRSRHNKARDTAIERYNNNPDIYTKDSGGKAYRGLLDRKAIYEDEGWAKLTLNQALPKPFGIPIGIPILGNFIPVPVLPRRYGDFGRAFGAYFARAPIGSRRRILGDAYFNPYVGADVGKMGKAINPALEYFISERLPGLKAKYSISKEYETLPVQLGLSSVDQWDKIGRVAAFESLVGELKLTPIDAMRFVGQLPAHNFYFDPVEKRYNFKTDLEDNLKLINGVDKSIGDKPVERSIEATMGKAKKMKFYIKDQITGKTREADKTEYRNQKDEIDFQLIQKNGVYMKYSPGDPPPGGAFWTIPGATVNAFFKKNAEEQEEIKNFYKKYAMKEHLPHFKKSGEKWEMEIGEDYRNYLVRRDGMLMLSTLAMESEETRKVSAEKVKNGELPEEEYFSMFDLVNLIHRAEELHSNVDPAYGQLDSRDGWLVNNTRKTLKLKITERGETKTLEIPPQGYLVDNKGNLIPNKVKLAKKDDLFDLKNGELQIDDKSMDGEGYRLYWNRIVGDRENPHLRFIRFRSEDAGKFAASMFKDKDVDPENLIMRTDGIKWGMEEYNQSEFYKVLQKGAPPQKRYKMTYLNEEENLHYKDSKGEYAAVIKLRTEVEDPATRAKTPVKYSEIQLVNNVKTEVITQQLADLFKQKMNVLLAQVPQQHPERAEMVKRYITDIKPGMSVVDFSHVFEQIGKDFVQPGVHPNSKNPIYDKFNDIAEVSDDPTWESPYRDELIGVAPFPADEAHQMTTEITGPLFDELKRRYESGQQFFFQWQSRLKEVSQYERWAYKLTGFYKGLAKFVQLMTNAQLIGTMVLLATPIGIPMLFDVFVASLLVRVWGKRWASRMSARYGARRIAALQHQQSLVGQEGFFAKAAQGEPPSRLEIDSMYLNNERLLFETEKVFATMEPDEWDKKDDNVINALGSFLGFVEEKAKG